MPHYNCYQIMETFLKFFASAGAAIAVISTFLVSLRGLVGITQDIVGVYRRLRDRVICRLEVFKLPGLVTVAGDGQKRRKSFRAPSTCGRIIGPEIL